MTGNQNRLRLSLLWAALGLFCGTLSAQNTFRVRHVFEISTGARPYGELFLASDGRVYGVGASGGASGQGAIFRCERDGSGYELLKSCTVDDGVFAYNGVVEGPDGRIYGTFSHGGDPVNGRGVVFAINKDGSGYTKLKVFTNASEGRTPSGTPVFGEDGKIYSTCQQGGTNDLGTIFRMDPDGTDFEVLHQCAMATGGWPTELTRLGPNFVGINYQGGSGSGGTFFSLAGTSYNVVEEFVLAKGINPSGAPIFTSNTDAVGTLRAGGSGVLGAVYQLGATYKLLHEFSGADGSRPTGKLAVSSRSGDYYGVTGEGGDNNGGLIYRLSPDGTEFEVLRSFDTDSGKAPEGGLLEVYPGVFLGTTINGGDNNLGTIFLLNTVAQAPKVMPRGSRNQSMTKSRAKVRGRASDEIRVLEVSYKVKGKPWRVAKGTASWSFNTKLKKGRNGVLVRARDHDGMISTPVRMILTRH